LDNKYAWDCPELSPYEGNVDRMGVIEVVWEVGGLILRKESDRGEIVQTQKKRYFCKSQSPHVGVGNTLLRKATAMSPFEATYDIVTREE
jgi:hypothetical protein